MKELDIAIRMKDYEKVANYKLTKKVPIILRLDGKSFHLLCKHRNKPFDEEITTAMQLTLIDLCKNIQGVMCGYTQSDEVTLVLSDYARPETSAYFDYRVQKLCSVSAAIAATSFNKYVRNLPKTALFDSRCFNIPKEEVANCFYWRLLDAKRNSINLLAQSLYSHKELKNIKTSSLLEKMKSEKEVDWNELNNKYKFGSFVYKEEGKWYITYDLEDGEKFRNYINQKVMKGY